MADLKSVSLTVALKEYFGYKPGQTLGEFMMEVRELTDVDKDWFRKNFPSVGYSISH